MERVLFYITGHGFGHATRVIEVINELVKAAPRVRPLISTAAPRWLFEERAAPGFEYLQCENDVGVAQKDWRGVDKRETLRRCAEFIRKELTLLQTQLDLVARTKVAAIVSDIPAVAFLVARKAGVPGFGITNFSWDWIYAPYLAEYPEYRFVVEHIRGSYSTADCLLRLPFHGDLSAFPVIEDIPLIARRSGLEREEIRRRLSLDRNRKMVLVYLGRFEHEKALSDPPAGRRAGETRRRDDYVFLAPRDIKPAGLLFQDLVKAADAVVTKPGYGIVSECIANRTPILYTSRQDFREYDALVDGIKKYAHGRFLPPEDFLGGRWAAHLDELLSAEYEWPEVAVNGAETAARRILRAM